MSRPVVRFTLSSLIGLVAVLGFGMAAIRSGSDLADRLAFNAMLAVLFIGLLGALVGRGGAWIGFALFGWGYAVLTLLPGIRNEFVERLPTIPLGRMVVDRLYGIPQSPDQSDVGPMNQDEYNQKASARTKKLDTVYEKYHYSLRSCAFLFVLIVALIGATLGRLLDARRAPAGGATT